MRDLEISFQCHYNNIYFNGTHHSNILHDNSLIGHNLAHYADSRGAIFTAFKIFYFDFMAIFIGGCKLVYHSHVR